MVLNEQAIAEALARGYCYPENEKKQVDMYLILAMTKEIQKLQKSTDARAFDHWLRREYEGSQLNAVTEQLMWHAWTTRGDPEMYDQLIKVTSHD